MLEPRQLPLHEGQARPGLLGRIGARGLPPVQGTQEELGHLTVAGSAREVDSRGAGEVGPVGAPAERQEDLADRRAAAARGLYQGRLAELVGRVGVRALLESITLRLSIILTTYNCFYR